MKISLLTVIGILFSVCLFGQIQKSSPPVLLGLAGQDIVICKGCTNNGVQIGNPTNAYCSYQWSPSTGLSNDTIAMPIACPDKTTKYEVIVTDNDGNAWRDSISIVVVTMSNKVYRPEVIGGTLVDSLTLDSLGVMTFVNIDNDDEDALFDMFDDHVKSVNALSIDDELIKWEINVNQVEASHVSLSVLGNTQSIKIWTTSNKQSGSEYILGSGNTGANLILSDSDGDGIYSRTVWIEGRKAHHQQGETQIKVTVHSVYGEVCESQIKITVIGVESIEWKGKENGYDSLATNSNNRFNSNALDDNDWNFKDTAYYNKNSIVGLKSYRVFPGARFNDTIPRNIVDIEIKLSTAPPESFDLHFKAFDIDDPFTDPDTSYANPEKFVDPNDEGNSGIYSGTSLVTNWNFFPNGYHRFDKNNDNRGLAEFYKDTLSNGNPRISKNGIILKYNNNLPPSIISKDGLGSIDVNSNQQIVNLGFVVSRQPGDNYRIAVNADKDFIESLRNEDKYDGLKIVDSNAAANGNNNQMIDWHNYTSHILTVWRGFYIELDAMENSFIFNYHKRIIIEDFEGNDASNTTKIYTGVYKVQGSDESENLNYVNYSIYGQQYLGRYENGSLSIGQDFWEEPREDVIVSERGTGTNGIIKGNSDFAIVSDSLKTFNLINGIYNNQSMPFVIMNSTKTDSVTGIVGQITKVNGDYEYIILPNMNSSPLSNNFLGSSLRIAGYEDDDVVITDVNSLNLSIKTSILKIPAFIGDDDDASLYNEDDLPIAKTREIYQRVYLELEKAPIGNSLIIPTSLNEADSGLGEDDIIINKTISEENASADYETRDLWIVYGYKAYQPTRTRDNDSDAEGALYGLTAANFNDMSGIKMTRGGTGHAIYFETYRDGSIENNIPNLTEQIDFTMAHEIGHQFGLAHGDRGKSLVPEYNSNRALSRMGIMGSGDDSKIGPDGNNTLINRHCNLIRCRIGSPGKTR